MGTVIDEHSLKIYQKINQGDLTAMRNRTTLLRAEQSRAEQSRAEQSRAEQSRAEQSRAEQSRAEQSRAAASSQPIALCRWLAFLGEPRMGTVTQIRDLDSAPSRAWANCALACPPVPFRVLGYFTSCEAFETAYYIYDKNIHWMFLLYAKARDG